MRLNIVVCGDAGIFAEVVQAFRLAAERAGHAVTVGEQAPVGVNIYFVGRADGVPENLRHRAHHILYNFEQRVLGGEDRCGAVLTVFPHVHQKLVSAGAKAVHCPLGWSPFFEGGEPCEETIDVLHIGLMREGRKAEVYAQHEDLITLRAGFGAERDRWIREVRINLIVQTWRPGYHLPVLRWLLIACKKKFCLVDHHESYPGIPPWVLGAFFDADLRANVKLWLEAGQDARNCHAQKVYDYLRSQPSYEQNIQAALDKLERALRGSGKPC